MATNENTKCMYKPWQFFNLYRKVILCRQRRSSCDKLEKLIAISEFWNFCRENTGVRHLQSPHNLFLNQFVEIPRRSIIVCFLSLLLKDGLNPPPFEISCSWPRAMDLISMKTPKLTSKGTWRQVFIYLRPPIPSPPVTHCMNTCTPVLIHTGKGGRR